MTRTTKAWIGTFASNGINLAIGIATGVLAARLLLPDDRGQLAEVMFWPSLIASIGILSLPAALTVHTARHGKDKQIGGDAVTLSLLLAAFWVGFGLLVLPWVIDPSLRQLMLLYLVAFLPLNFVGLVLSAADQGQMRFVRFNLFRLVPSLVYLVGILLLWRLGRVSVAGLVWATWFGTFLAVTLRFWGRSGDLGWRASPKKWRDLLIVGLQLHSAAVAGILFQQADRFVLVTFFDHETLGLYVVAMTFAGAAIGLVTSAFQIVLLPRLASNPSEEARREHLRMGLAVSLWLAGGIVLFLIAAAPFLVPWLFGAAFAPAVGLAVVLLLAQVPASFTQVTIVALWAFDDWRTGPYSQSAALGVFAGSVAPLTLLWSAVGIPVALLLGYVAAAAIVASRLRARTGLRPIDYILPDPRLIGRALREMRAAHP